MAWLYRKQPPVQEQHREHAANDRQRVSADQQCERPMINPSVTQYPSKEDQWHSDEKAYWERQIRLNKWLNGITAAGVVAAIVAFIPLIIQMRAAQITTQTAIEQLQMAKTSLQTTERAWVTVKGITLNSPMIAGQEPLAVAGLHNSGRSPALHMTVHHWLKIAPSLLPTDKPELRRTPVASLAVLGPDSKVTSATKFLTVTMEEMSNMRAGKAHLYSYGIIQYRDVFYADHWTRFCYRTRDLSDLNMVACPEWNEVDEEQGDRH